MGQNIDWLVEFFRVQARLGAQEGDYTRTRNSCERLIRLLPEDIDAWYLAGEAALINQDLVTAVICFERLCELDPRNALYAVQLGRVFLQMREWERAETVLRQAVVLVPEDGQVAQLLNMAELMKSSRQVLSAQVEQERNAPCACGSGLKYKKCCQLKLATEGFWVEQLELALQAGDWRRVLSVVAEQGVATAQYQRAAGLAQYHLGYGHLARPLLESCLNSFGEDAEVLAVYGDLLLSDNRDKAETLARKAVALDPLSWRSWLLLSACRARAGDAEGAERVLRELLGRIPSCQMGWERLGEILCNRHRGGEALEALRGWALREEASPEPWYFLGYFTLVQGLDVEQAKPHFERALELKPDHYQALCALGGCLVQLGRFDAGVELIMQGIQLKPDYGQGWELLGSHYIAYGRLGEAEGCFMRAIAIDPDCSRGWQGLAYVYRDAKVLDVAENVMRQALALNGDMAELWNGLGVIMETDNRATEASECYRKAMELDPATVLPRINQSLVLSHFVRLDEATDMLRPLCQSHALARSNILFLANCHPDWSAERLYELYRQHAAPYFPQRRYLSHANDRAPDRRLRIGYVSPDFRAHACSYFTIPLLENHDRSRVEVFAYSEARREDAVTETIKGKVEHWRRTTGLSDEQLAEAIRADGIDILVDLAGHTSGNRLATFSLKPAPVQVSWWIGCGYTSGLESIDYFLCDEELVPQGAEHLFAEEPWRIECPSIAYRPNESMPELSALPALQNGYVTFGSLSRSIRLNHKVVRAWSAILLRVPGSRLVLNSAQFKDEGVCEHFAAEFERCGIARERLDMGFTSPPWSVLAGLDIALDCFPHNSGTTLCESLWMGLPYVTLRDRPSMGRIGAVILRGAGCAEWIADSEEEYIDKVVALASDLDALSEIRAGLREQMRKSAFCDGKLLSSRVEAAFQGMWGRYCESLSD